MIKLNKLSRVYRTGNVETAALSEIDLEVKSGEFVMIVGESGGGKSTLLSILGMLDSPSSGEYWFDGQDVSGFNETRLAEIRKHALGYVFQSFNLIDQLTVGQNIELPMQYQNLAKAERAERVDAMLQRFNIEHRKDHLPQQLSGGQQQRVAVARALVVDPKVILADEPTGNLDSQNGEEVLQMLKQLNQEGTTIVMVTHSEHALTYASRVIRLKDGQICQDESVTAAS